MRRNVFADTPSQNKTTIISTKKFSYRTVRLRRQWSIAAHCTASAFAYLCGRSKPSKNALYMNPLDIVGTQLRMIQLGP